MRLSVGALGSVCGLVDGEEPTRVRAGSCERGWRYLLFEVHYVPLSGHEKTHLVEVGWYRNRYVERDYFLM